MAAERFQTVRRRSDNAEDEALHIVLLFFGDFHIHHISGHGELHEKHRSVHMGQRLALCRNRFYLNIL